MIQEPLAPESSKIQKTRAKLKKQLQDIEKLITQEALAKKADEISSWIARHSCGRIALKNKNIALFDENQNTAKLSKCASSVLHKLQNSNSVTTCLKDKNIYSN